MAKEVTLETKKELVDLVKNRKTGLTLSNGRKVYVGYITGDTQDLLDDLIVNYEAFKKKNGLVTNGEKSKEPKETIDQQILNKGNRETRRFFAKCVAAILLNNYFKIRFFWWLKWRWLYYFSNWNGQDYVNVILEAKKKATEGEYSLAMVLLMDMTTTWITMTKKEAEEYRRELDLVKEAQSLKNSRA